MDFANMDEFVLHATNLGWSGLRREYDDLVRTTATAPSPCVAWHQNMDRNRYKDVQCPDASRVVLSRSVPPETDYINANTIRFEGVDKLFVAAQGPMEKTASDFWRMIYQLGEQGTPAIIMLCQCVEEGIDRCFQYWPMVQGSSTDYGSMIVANKNTESIDRFKIYTLEVLPNGCSNSIIATLYHTADWPDRGLPKSPMGLLRMLKHMRQNKLVPGPWVCHCSAGLGRTGTLLAVEIGMRQLVKGQQPRVLEIVRRMREQRPGAVRTAAQFVFIFACLLYYCHAKGRHCKLIADFHANFCAAVGAGRI